MSLSNELITEVAEQPYVLGRTLGQIAERFALPFSTLADGLQRIGKKLEPAIESLKSAYRKSKGRQAFGTRRVGERMAEMAIVRM